MHYNGTILLIDTYQKYPELFDLAIKYREAMIPVSRALFLLIVFTIARTFVLTVVDLFNISPHNQISELEDAENQELEDAENRELEDAENRELEEKLEEMFKKTDTENQELEKRLEEMFKKKLDNLESRYMCCQWAAQKFVDSHPAVDTRN